jgi:glutathione S-transferase
VATLYYLPGSAAMAPHAALEEAGADYELVRVVRENGVPVSPPDYLEISPFGRVPAYVDGDLRLFESAAIVMHVADAHPGSGLLPAVGSPERAHAYRWLVYLTNTLQPTYLNWFYPDRVGVEDEAVKTHAARELDEIFAWIDGQLAGREYLVGNALTGADLFLFMLTDWGRELEPGPFERPDVRAHYRRVAARPAVARMLAAHELEPMA